jgi:hypothetical protein
MADPVPAGSDVSAGTWRGTMTGHEEVDLPLDADSAADAFVEDPEHAVRLRAYDISQRDDAGSPDENWQRAREELAGE